MNEIDLINLIKKEQDEIHTMNKTNSVIKNNIINLAQKKNIKQKQIADALNMQASNFSRTLKSDNLDFSPNQIKEIAKLLDVNINQFAIAYENVKIVGYENKTFIDWFLPFEEAEYLQLPKVSLDYVAQLPNDSIKPVLSAIRVENVEWDIGFKLKNIKGKSVNNQYIIFDSNRKKIEEDCHGYLCVVSITPRKKARDLERKQRLNKYNAIGSHGEDFLAEIYIDGNYINCEPYVQKYPEYRVHKDDVKLCSPILFRTMHKNIVKKASEINDI